MRTLTLATALILMGIATFTLRADYLKNGDMKDRVANWRGDGEAAFLAPDGTEGNEGDKGVIPVVKIALSKGHSRGIYQDYETKDMPSGQRIHVEVYASLDFKRSKFDSDYSSDINWRAGSTWYGGDGMIPKVDFWIYSLPEYGYKLANLKPGQWVNVDGKWEGGQPYGTHTVGFIVPPGEGAIYIRKATATK